MNLLFSLSIGFICCSVLYVDEMASGVGSCLTKGDTCTLEVALSNVSNGDVIEFVGTSEQEINGPWTISNNITFSTSENVVLKGGFFAGGKIPFNFSSDVNEFEIRNLTFRDFSTQIFDNGQIFLNIESCVFENTAKEVFSSNMSYFDVSIVNSQFHNTETLIFDFVSGTFSITNSIFYQDEGSSVNPTHRSLIISSYTGHEIKIHDSTFYYHSGFDVTTKTTTGVLNVEIINSSLSRNEAEEGGAFSIYSFTTIPLEIVLRNSNFLSNCATVRGGGFYVYTDGSLKLSIESSLFDCNGYLTDYETSSDIQESGTTCPYKCMESLNVEKGSNYGGSFYVSSQNEYDISISNSHFNNSGAAKSLQIYSDFYVYGTSFYAETSMGKGYLQMNDSIISHHYQGYPIYVTSEDTQNSKFHNSHFYHLYGQPDVINTLNESVGESSGSDDSTTDSSMFTIENGYQLTYPFFFNSRSDDVFVSFEDCVFDSQSKIDFRRRCSLDSQTNVLPSGLIYIDGHTENEEPGGITAYLSVKRTTILGTFQGDEGGCFRHHGFLGGFNVEILDSYIEGCASCKSGGTFFVSESTSAVITNTSFRNSFSKGDGGTLMILGENGNSMELVGLSFFSSESWSSGGAVHVDSMNLNITNCTFFDNEAKIEGGAVSADIPQDFHIGIYDCNFARNQQNSAETSVDVGGGQIYLNSQSSISTVLTSSIERSTFVGGWARLDGGDILLNQGSSRLIDNVFTGSRADRSGGCIYGANSKVVIVNNRFQGSVAGVSEEDSSSGIVEGNGGSMFFVSDRTWERSVQIFNTQFRDIKTSLSGGGIYALDTYVILFNCNFTGCVALENGGCIYLQRSKLYFLNDSDSVKVNHQVCFVDPDVEEPVFNDGVSVIYNGSANQGGGIYVGEESEFQTHQVVYIRACHALVGGGLYLGSPSFFPGIDVYFLENTGVYGAAISSVIRNPELNSQSSIVVENEPLWYYCVHLKGNVGTFTSSVFFLGDYDYVMDQKKDIWDGMDCQDFDDNSLYCQDYGSTPNKIDRVEISDHTVSLTLGGEIPFTVGETDATSRTFSMMYLYPEEAFHIHFTVSDWNGQIFSSFPSFSIQMEGYGDNPPSIVTATEDIQSFDEKLADDGVTGLIKFEELSVSGKSGEEYIIRFSFDFFDVLAEHFILVSFVECPYGMQPDVIGDDGNIDEMTTCVDCSRGFYKFLNSNEKCLECSEGMYCEDNVVEVLPDYWASVESSNGEVMIYQCVDNYCLGGSIQVIEDSISNEEDSGDDSDYTPDEDTDEPTTNSIITSSTNRRSISVRITDTERINVYNGCEGNRDGDLPLCSGCSDGYSAWNDECRLCDNDEFNFLPFSALIIIQILFFGYVHVTTTCTSKGGKASKIPSKRQEKYEKKIMKKLSRDKRKKMFDFEEGDASNNSSRLLVDYIQMCFLVTNFGSWFKSNDSMKDLRNLFIGPIDFLRSLFLFNPSFGGDELMGDTLSRCPFALHGEMVVFWRVFQQIFMLVLCLIPFFLTCCWCECLCGGLRKCLKLTIKIIRFFGRSSEKVDSDLTDQTPPLEFDGKSSDTDEKNEDGDDEEEETEMEFIKKDVDDDDDDIIFSTNEEKEEEEEEEGGGEDFSDEDEETEESVESSEKSEKDQEEQQSEQNSEEQDNIIEEKEEEETTVEQKLLETMVFLENKEEEIEQLDRNSLLRCLFCIPRFLIRCTSYSAFRITLVNLMLMIHTPLTLVLMDFLFCTRYENVGYRVIKYSFIECYSLSYNLWLVLFFLPILIIVILFPIVVTCILCCNKGKLQKARFKSVFGVYYESYRSKCYWFEIVVIFEKMFLMLSNMIYNTIKISTHDLIGLNHTFHGIIIGGCLLIHQIFQPYESKFENKLQFLNLFSLLIMIGVQEEYYKATSNVGVMISFIMFLILVVSMGCCCLCRVKVIKKIICCCDKKNKGDNDSKMKEKQTQTDTENTECFDDEIDDDEKNDDEISNGDDGEREENLEEFNIKEIVTQNVEGNLQEKIE